MWEIIVQSGQLIIGVLALFALFMAALFFMERGVRRKRTEKRYMRPALRVIRCEKQNKAA
jgi:hypothetical protein